MNSSKEILFYIDIISDIEKMGKPLLKKHILDIEKILCGIEERLEILGKKGRTPHQNIIEKKANYLEIKQQLENFIFNN